MKSFTIVFPEKRKADVREEEVGSPGPGELLCAARKSLISIGTEGYCFQGEFDDRVGGRACDLGTQAVDRGEDTSADSRRGNRKAVFRKTRKLLELGRRHIVDHLG